MTWILVLGPFTNSRKVFSFAQEYVAMPSQLRATMTANFSKDSRRCPWRGSFRWSKRRGGRAVRAGPYPAGERGVPLAFDEGAVRAPAGRPPSPAALMSLTPIATLTMIVTPPAGPHSSTCTLEPVVSASPETVPTPGRPTACSPNGCAPFKLRGASGSCPCRAAGPWPPGLRVGALRLRERGPRLLGRVSPEISPPGVAPALSIGNLADPDLHLIVDNHAAYKHLAGP